MEANGHHHEPEAEESQPRRRRQPVHPPNLSGTPANFNELETNIRYPAKALSEEVKLQIQAALVERQKAEQASIFINEVEQAGENGLSEVIREIYQFFYIDYSELVHVYKKLDKDLPKSEREQIENALLKYIDNSRAFLLSDQTYPSYEEFLMIDAKAHNLEEFQFAIVSEYAKGHTKAQETVQDVVSSLRQLAGEDMVSIGSYIGRYGSELAKLDKLINS
jgi:hypothetical protein